jgi:hypothetical protein
VKKIFGFLPTVTLAAVVLIACFKQAPTPGQQVQDFNAGLQCNIAHWGEPFPQLVADCWQGDVTAAVDGIADIEVLFETQAAQSDAGVDAGATAVALVQTSFPYKDNLQVMTRLSAKRLALKH